MQHKTKRLILRPPEQRDVKAYVAIHNSQFVLRYNAMTTTTEDQMQARFAEAEYLANTVFLEEKETGKLIGAIFIEDDSLRWGVNSKEISYFLDEAFCRRGYMKEALHAVIGWLFETQKLECVGARAFAPNTASRALLAALGFHEDGVIPRCVKGYGDIIFDDTVHSLFQNDFQ